MNITTKQSQSFLLRRYYKTAQLGWFHPKTLHWAKIVTSDGYWRWIRSDGGVRKKLDRFAPLHVYQTVFRFKTNKPPRGRDTSGFLLGGSILFDADILDKNEPVTLWKLIDLIPMLQELIEVMSDMGDYRFDRVTYSGYRGIHISFTDSGFPKIPIPLTRKNAYCRQMKNLVRERKQIARAIGFRCRKWDWKVTADVWRVVRVPWSIHGSSSLRAIPLKSISNSSDLKKELRDASPFSFTSFLKVRIKHNIPFFVFIDEQAYGPYRKGWTTKLPIAVALHLIWLDLARPREKGPSNVAKWFERGWQIMFRGDSKSKIRYHLPEVPTL